jgi:hypothetical protein
MFAMKASHVTVIGRRELCTAVGAAEVVAHEYSVRSIDYTNASSETPAETHRRPQSIGQRVLPLVRPCMYAHGWTGCTDAGTGVQLQVNPLAMDWQPQICCAGQPESLRTERHVMANLVFLQAVLAPLCACRMLSASRPTPSDSVCWTSHAAQELAALCCRSSTLPARQGGFLRCPWRAAGTISRWCMHAARVAGSLRKMPREVESSHR